MQNTVRRSIALRKDNEKYIAFLVRTKKTKNFSRAINEMIEKSREEKRDDETMFNNGDC